MNDLSLQQKEIIEEMNSMGYQFMGISDMGFLQWKAKETVKLEDDPYEHEIFNIDGWESVRESLNDIRELQQNFTLEQLKERLNGEYSLIEYGAFNTSDIKIAVVNYPKMERSLVEEQHKKRISKVLKINAEFGYNDVEIELNAREGMKMNYAVNECFEDYSNEELKEAARIIEKGTVLGRIKEWEAKQGNHDIVARPRSRSF